MYQQEFTFVDGELQNDITAWIIPARISSYDNYNNYKPMIAEGEDAKRIIQNMNTYSKGFGGLVFGEDGTLLLQEEDLKED